MAIMMKSEPGTVVTGFLERLKNKGETQKDAFLKFLFLSFRLGNFEFKKTRSLSHHPVGRSDPLLFDFTVKLPLALASG
jgi:hypothetical protein